MECFSCHFHDSFVYRDISNWIYSFNYNSNEVFFLHDDYDFIMSKVLIPSLLVILGMFFIRISNLT